MVKLTHNDRIWCSIHSVLLQSDAHSHIEQNTVLRNDMSLLQEELDQQQRLTQALLRRKVK